jgi:hypothetical protein
MNTPTITLLTASASRAAVAKQSIDSATFAATEANTTATFYDPAVCLLLAMLEPQ